MKQENKTHPEISYIVLCSDDVISRKLENYLFFKDMFERYRDICWTLYRCEDGVPVEFIANDGGEPEDQVLVRDWNWVPVALKNAYELGVQHGKGGK